MLPSGYGINGFGAGAFGGVNPFSSNPPDNPTGKAFPRILLGSVLAIPASLLAQPFSQTNWQNPRGPQRGVSLIDQTSSGLAVRALPPVYPNSWLTFDWPNPRGATFPSDLRGYVQQATVRFIGQDKFFGLGGSPCFDWPNPRGYQRSINLNDFAPTRLPTTAKPFLQTDYQNPRGYQRATSLNDFGPTRLPATATPFGQSNWPVPNGKIPASILRTYTQNGRTVGLTSPPFKQGDWPVPKGYIPSITLKTLTSSGQSLFDSIPPYAGQNRVYNWPNPRGATFPSELRGYIQQATVRFIGKDSFFGLAGNPTMDWPVPKGPLFPISLRCLVNAHMPPIQWGAVDTGNNAGWGPISGVNSPGWGAVNDSNSVTWVLVDVSTDSPTGFK